MNLSSLIRAVEDLGIAAAKATGRGASKLVNNIAKDVHELRVRRETKRLALQIEAQQALMSSPEYRARVIESMQAGFEIGEIMAEQTFAPKPRRVRAVK